MKPLLWANKTQFPKMKEWNPTQIIVNIPLHAQTLKTRFGLDWNSRGGNGVRLTPRPPHGRTNVEGAANKVRLTPHFHMVGQMWK